MVTHHGGLAVSLRSLHIDVPHLPTGDLAAQPGQLPKA